jgi:hypothetical protein
VHPTFDDRSRTDTVTKADPNPGAEKRGRHAKREDPPEDTAPPQKTDEPKDDEAEKPAEAKDVEAKDDGAKPPVAEKPAAAQPRREEPEEKKQHSSHALAHHPAGASLLTAAGLVIGLAITPWLFDQVSFDVATRAADAARSAAAPWPAGGEPWFWPGWVATTAALVSLAVLVVAAIGVRVPDVVVLATAVVLTVATGWAALSTLDVVNARLWELIPVCLICVLAFGMAATALFRWRSPTGDDKGSGAGEVAGVTVGSWLLVVLVLLGGSAIASSAETHAFGNVTSPPQDLAGLLSVRAADAPELDALRGSWVPQVAAAQVTDDTGATAYAVVHHDLRSRFPTVLARGDDVDAIGLDDTWWVSIAVQPYASQAEAATWCSTNGIAGCTPLQVGG